MVCDACGANKGSSWASYSGMWGLEQEILSQFVSQKCGRNQRGFFDFELCGECNKEYKKFLSQKLKEKITTELASKNLIDCPLLLEYGYGSKFEIDDWNEVRNALVENIRRYSNEWQIKQMNYNQDGKEYFHPETNSQTSQLTILIRQSASIEYSSNGFLIVKQPKMYLKSYFSPEQWSQIEKNLAEQSIQPSQFPTKLVSGLVILTIVVVGGIIGLVYWRKRKKDQKH